MQVEIRRKWETSRSVTGEMWIDGAFFCYTLEPARTTPVHPGHPCIPAGTYKVIFTVSPHLGYLTPELVNVPGRSDIRWHIGNKPEDVLGCVVVGNAHQTDWVSNSGETFHKLMATLKQDENNVTAVYTDPQ